MRNGNELVTKIIQVFSNAVADRSLRDPIPGSRYTRLALDIKDCLQEILDSRTINKILLMCKAALGEYGEDIPNDDKDDILYIVENHIKNVQASQFIRWTFKWLMISEDKDYKLTEADYDKIQDYATSQIEIDTDCCSNLDAVVARIIREFDNMLKSKNISLTQPANPDYAIDNEIYAKLYRDICNWIRNIL